MIKLYLYYSNTNNQIRKTLQINVHSTLIYCTIRRIRCSFIKYNNLNIRNYSIITLIQIISLLYFYIEITNY